MLELETNNLTAICSQRNSDGTGLIAPDADEGKANGVQNVSLASA